VSPDGVSDPAVKIKVCGLTGIEDALACVSGGADWIGLNFHPGSSRRIEPSLAAEIVAALPPPAVAVGLFVDRPPDEVASLADRVGLSTIQLHGDEPPTDLVALGHLRIIRAFRLGDSEAVACMLRYLSRAKDLGRPPDAVLVDAHVTGQPGGTGHPIDSGLLQLLPRLPHLILAGGLTPQNVAGRIDLARPWMVDVASGVESSPGRKDPARVAAFVRAARGERDSKHDQ
jgi:phosphoribosylanthranilate isomerase